jgi:hypothetical protein
MRKQMTHGERFTHLYQTGDSGNARREARVAVL